MSQLNELSSRRTARINLRVDPEVDDVLRRAAAIERKSLSAFMLDAARSHAEQAVAKERTLQLREAEFARVLDELDRPARVVEPVLKLADRVAQRIAARTSGAVDEPRHAV